MDEPIYYNGAKLLAKKDLRGLTPEIFISTGNRTTGKTTYFNRKLVDDFLNEGKKFGLVYRYENELCEVDEKFFKDIGELFFSSHTFTTKSKSKGMYLELYLDGIPCGYAIALNSSEKIKKMSHLFTDVDQLYMDEFQSETNHYCSMEINRFISVHMSLARGHGKQVRYLPLYMCSNCISLINPYYAELGITTRLKKDTKFLRGDGFVLEQSYLDSVAQLQMESGFNRAFKNSKYVKYGAENVYLNDDDTFIETLKGKSIYAATLRYNNRDFGVREFRDLGLIYCDDRPDRSHPMRISSTTADHKPNYIMLRSNEFILYNWRYYFQNGCFRFKDLRCKEAVMNTLSF